MTTFDRVSDRLGQILAVLAAFCLTAMMLHICMDVVGRFAFSRPLPSTIEIVAEWWMPALIFLPMVAVARHHENITVDLFYDRSGPKMRAFMNLMSNACFTVFLGFIAWGAGEQALRAYGEGEYIVGMIPVVTWPARFFLPVAATLTGLLTFMRALRALRHLTAGPGHDAGGEI
ncbi:TRAP-type C4-dicarboxylate transport system, small permease component [Salinihabitans flavidus]|uniref:TRAP transporter small permease protein n=1 Tax=Salinihabitans flavidus TaxID=569882 RepID=A0A1H8NU31_9RHOB|nr:TRAP transporter small permease subunit [Salinihabitans flavidus]SEO33145.1 TRAP-type C4-dicarboxylate transport system, small permease component [Salinihabitans flavidus]